MATPELDGDLQERLVVLVQRSDASRDRYRDAAARVDHERMAVLLQVIATERSAQAEELRRLLEAAGVAPPEPGAGAAPSGPTGSRNTEAVLAELAGGEGGVRAAYEELVHDERLRDGPLHDGLVRQLARVRADHERIQDLLEAQTLEQG